MGKQVNRKKIAFFMGLVLLAVFIFLFFGNKKMEQEEAGLFEKEQSAITAEQSNVNTGDSISGSFENGDTFVVESTEAGIDLKDHITNIDGESVGTTASSAAGTGAQTATSTQTETANASSTGAAAAPAGTNASSAAGTGTQTATSTQTETANASSTGAAAAPAGTTANSAAGAGTQTATTTQTGTANTSSTGAASSAAGTTASNSAAGTGAQTATTAQTGTGNTNNTGAAAAPAGTNASSAAGTGAQTATTTQTGTANANNTSAASSAAGTNANSAAGTGAQTATNTQAGTSNTSSTSAAAAPAGTNVSSAAGTGAQTATTTQTGTSNTSSTGASPSAAVANASNSAVTGAQTATTTQTGAGNASNSAEQPSSSQRMEALRGGTFYMGSPVTEEERGRDEVQYLAAIKPFSIGKYEVTQLEYQEVMGTNPSYFKGPRLPVESVSWFDAIEYCNKLSLKHNLTPAYTIAGNANNRIVYWDRDANGYRLPTEEEWEYTCRAGTTTPFNTGRTITRRMANYFNREPVNVGSYAPNGWGLYDMHGNVAEWCWDRYQGHLYRQPESNMENMDNRVLRGGSWFTMTMRMRSAFRDHANPMQKSQAVGFRVARNE